ncbi:MAG: hypothetical protein VCD00_17550 [Candidatus Hydrogenedentota bacterium]
MGEVFKVIGIIVATLVFGTFALMSVGVGILSLNPNVQDTFDGFNFLSSRRVTLSEFNQIETGMSYEQVLKVVGKDAAKTASWSFEDEDGAAIRATTYTWQNDESSEMNTTFTMVCKRDRESNRGVRAGAEEHRCIPDTRSGFRRTGLIFRSP